MSTILKDWGLQDHSGVVKKFDASMVPQQSMLYDMFRNAGTYRPVPGLECSWDEYEQKRRLAPVTGAAGHYNHVELVTKTRRSSTLAWIKLKKTIPGHELFNFRGPGEDRENALGRVGIELAELWTLITNTREYMCAQALLGTLVVNSTTVPGTDAPFSIAFGNNTYNAGVNWATPASLVVNDIKLAEADHVQACGMPAKIAITNDVVMRALEGNDQIREWARYRSGAEALASAIWDPKLLETMRLGGLDWLTSFYGYVPAGGSFTRFFADQNDSGATDRAVFLPPKEMLREVLRMAEGRATIPAKGGGYGGEGELAGLTQAQPGPYAWSKVSPEGDGLDVFAGWVGLPIVTYPEAVTVINTTP